MGLVAQSGLISSTRASTGWARDSRGLWVPSGVNTLRMDHDQWGAPIGALIEEQRTNRCIWANGLSHWDSGTGATTTDAAAPGLDGLISAARIVTTSGNTSVYHGANINFTTPSGGATHIVSTFVKSAGIPAVSLWLADPSTYANAIYANLNFGTGAFSTNAGGSGTAVTGGAAERYPDGWWRIWVAGTIGTATALAIGNSLPPTSGVTGEGALFWGMQCEAVGTTDAQPSSPIITTGAALTRAADSCAVRVGRWLNQSAGTFLIDYDVPRINQVIFGVCGAAGFNNSFYAGANYAQVVQSGSGVGGGVSWTPTLGRNKLAAGYDSGGWRVSHNGSGVGSTTLVLGQPIATVMLGGAPWGSADGVGHARNWRYWPSRRIDADLQSLSTL